MPLTGAEINIDSNVSIAYPVHAALFTGLSSTLRHRLEVMDMSLSFQFGNHGGKRRYAAGWLTGTASSL